MILREIQELSINLQKIIDEFNRNCMPEGYFICEETDGTIIITDEISCNQTILIREFLDKEKLTKKEVISLFKKHRF
ncbi:hypothetical protein NM952_06830 [Pasteurella multocida subsp. multocida]|uniref:Uncharacterized protein n=1 Tax=Pasteurella multocida TaxID=747 RepID=A0A9X3UQ99_PASMD|nr:hypothetical protein [Pasteurella multocida]MBF6979977.1 hypothetical protein [Pasteurella multocida]MDA5618313.1 hypothetical protein [Pasteurella multocida subsp. multocida]MDA5619999.1 hypothetical protein [Pasteurella multocida subsp. multocida]MDA5622705.1 hypothetical protein [Pasteurella multocida]ODS44586.1 hypothetical protein BGK37_03480 [Pasteurella multocida]